MLYDHHERCTKSHIDSELSTYHTQLLLRCCVIIRKYKLALLVYKCLHGLAPKYLTTACVLLSTLSGRPHLRSSEDNKLFVLRSLTASMGTQAFCSSGPTSWNTSARLWHSSLTLKQFECLLKASLFA